MRSIIALAGLALAFTAAPAFAQTDTAPNGPPIDGTATQLKVGTLVADGQATHFSVPVTCETPTGTSGACQLSVVASWRTTPLGKWSPSGTKHVVAQQQVSIPAGKKQTVTVAAPVSKLRDVLSRKSGAAIVTLAFSDATGALDESSVYVFPPTARGGCGANFSKVLSGSLDELHGFGKQRSWDTLLSPDVARGMEYRVTSATARVRYAGITMTAQKGTMFGINCAALSDYNNRRFFPSVFLYSGKVRAKGMPKGPGSFAVTVDTLEGNLGMRKREYADITVTNDSRRSVATMKVHKGSSGQVTPTFHGAKSSPCTNGSSLSVNLAGTIRRIG